MKYLMIALSLTLLTACSMSGFQPAASPNYWTSESLKNSMEFVDYIRLKDKDLRDCGIDPYANRDTGGSTEKALCMEKKGWINTAGATCKREVYKNSPECSN